MEGVEIVATCDPDPARQATYADATLMLDRESPDFVDIATRPDTHLELLALAAARGIPAIVQKPLAPDLATAREMLRLTGNLPVMVHENWRWQPWQRELHRRLQAGEIGQPFGYHFTMMNNDGLGPAPYAQQPYFARMPRLLMYESLIHPVDCAIFHLGPVQQVFALHRRRNPLIAGEDRALLLLSHAGGVDGIVEGQRYLAPEPPGPAMGHSLIEGERGRLLATANGDIFHNGQLVWQNKIHSGYKGDSVKATQEHFLSCLESGEEFETSLPRYLHAFAVIESAYQSAALGRVLEPEVLPA